MISVAEIVEDVIIADRVPEIPEHARKVEETIRLRRNWVFLYFFFKFPGEIVLPGTFFLWGRVCVCGVLGYLLEDLFILFVINFTLRMLLFLSYLLCFHLF